MGKISIKQLKKEIDYYRNNFENRMTMLEDEDCKIYNFHFMDIIVRDGKSYIFPKKPRKELP